MNSTIAAPVDWVKAVGNLRFPSKADRRLREIMDRNNEGILVGEAFGLHPPAH
jgi:ABC-type polysaccharide/polyol phosphate transport system ATPase subunit